jgi:hypothetical protein
MLIRAAALVSVAAAMSGCAGSGSGAGGGHQDAGGSGAGGSTGQAGRGTTGTTGAGAGDSTGSATGGAAGSSNGPADASNVVGDALTDSLVGATDAPQADSSDGSATDGHEDQAQDTGPSGCAGLFCEDFELGQLDATKWDVQMGAGGTLVIQKQTVAHGKYAMQVHGLAGPTDYALIVTKAAPAALQGAHFGRAYFFITPKPLTSGHTQMVFAGTTGTGPANGPGPFPKLKYMEVANINGGWQIGFDLLDVAPLIEEVAYPAGSPQVPVMTWTCLEWQFNDQPDVVNLWVDGQAIGTFDNQHVSYPGGHVPGSPLYSGKSTGLIGSFTVFGFGFHDWHPSKPFDLFYDDIVLDTKRVGCLP